MSRLRKYSLLAFLVILSINFSLGQDKANPELIESIRKHYYDIANNPDKYELQDLGKTKVWLKDGKIHKIELEKGNSKEEICFEGSAEKLNFYYLKNESQEIRCYFRHFDNPYPFPTMERYVENGNYIQPTEKEYFDMNLQFSSRCLKLYYDILGELFIEKDEAYLGNKNQIRSIDSYGRNIESDLNKEKKTIISEYFDEGDGSGTSREVSIERYNRAGSLVIKTVSSSFEGNGGTNNYSNTYFEQGEKVKLEVVNQASYYWIALKFYEERKDFKVMNKQRRYFRDGKAFFSLNQHFINGYSTYWDIRLEGNKQFK
ncbi:MAG: hypothetical protein MRZ79_14730 [Bacteroidia bacterium]|nr:hypothetical protein [Bacteroidia bacterium]